MINHTRTTLGEALNIDVSKIDDYTADYYFVAFQKAVEMDEINKASNVASLDEFAVITRYYLDLVAHSANLSESEKLYTAFVSGLYARDFINRNVM